MDGAAVTVLGSVWIGILYPFVTIVQVFLFSMPLCCENLVTIEMHILLNLFCGGW